MNRPCITLLTDFGLQDSYVGQMKGIIAGINPDAIVVDVTHSIPPQQISSAAVALVDSIDAFPVGTIHVCIVDPGVGGSRRAVAVEIDQHKFVCPDNGLLTLVLRRGGFQRAVQLDQPRWWRSVVSKTFHGRDLFAPVAAAWSLGHDLSEFGSPITEPLIELSMPECEVDATETGGTARGQVLAIDHFGNLITNISRTNIPTQASHVEVQIATDTLPGIVPSYASRQPGDRVALFGSAGRLEVAVVNGNAARQLPANVGDPVIVRWY